MKLVYFLLTACLLLGLASRMAEAQSGGTPAGLRLLADDYYRWRNENYPVNSSNEGLHTWDDKLTDYSEAAVQMRRTHVKDLLARVQAMKTESWAKDDRIDWVLLRAQLERTAFFDRVMNFVETDPQTYVDECSNSIFSLLKKEYDTPRNRALSA